MDRMKTSTQPGERDLTGALPWAKLLIQGGVGLLGGGLFGALFGVLASFFDRGPALWQGVIDSAPFFACLGLVAGVLLATEAPLGKASIR
jgi:hypothetical protein